MAFEVDLTEKELLKEHPKYTAMKKYLDVVNPLRSGTEAMRMQGETLLPKYAGESAAKYKERRDKSFLFPAYADTLERHVSRPFSREIEVSNTNNQRLDGIEEDANLEGDSLTNLGRSLFCSAEHAGMVSVLINMPSGQASDNSLSTMIKEGRNPFFTEILADQIYNWKETVINGKRTLSEIRIKVNPETVVIYKMVEKNCEFKTINKVDSKWVENIDLTGSAGFPRIPLETAYFKRVRYMEAKPALWNLAEQNVKYWQQQSDQDSILAFARTGTYFAKAFAKDELKAVTIGANKLISSSNANSDFKVVEYGGKSVEIGEASLDKLQKQMEITGLKPEIQSTVNSTATGMVINSQAANSDIKVWAIVIEDLLERCYHTAAERIGSKLPEDFKIDIYRDFDVSGSREDMATLLQMQAQGTLSRKTLLDEAKRREVLGSKVNSTDELEEIDKEDFNTMSNLGGN